MSGKDRTALLIDEIRPFADPRRLKPTDTFRAATDDAGRLQIPQHLDGPEKRAKVR